jgi:hypothetical protein
VYKKRRAAKNAAQFFGTHALKVLIYRENANRMIAFRYDGKTLVFICRPPNTRAYRG